jgi:hypothetical protein
MDHKDTLLRASDKNHLQKKASTIGHAKGETLGDLVALMDAGEIDLAEFNRRKRNLFATTASTSNGPAKSARNPPDKDTLKYAEKRAVRLDGELAAQQPLVAQCHWNDPKFNLVVAARLHDVWRFSREVNPKTGLLEARIKICGGKEYDIANLCFEDLPEKYQRENLAAASEACAEIRSALRTGRPIDASFLEEASQSLHLSWCDRNKDWAPSEQLVEYARLPESEKNKDRQIIYEALKICQVTLEGEQRFSDNEEIESDIESSSIIRQTSQEAPFWYLHLPSAKVLLGLGSLFGFLCGLLFGYVGSNIYDKEIAKASFSTFLAVDLTCILIWLFWTWAIAESATVRRPLGRNRVVPLTEAAHSVAWKEREAMFREKAEEWETERKRLIRSANFHRKTAQKSEQEILRLEGLAKEVVATVPVLNSAVSELADESSGEEVNRKADLESGNATRSETTSEGVVRTLRAKIASLEKNIKDISTASKFAAAVAKSQMRARRQSIKYKFLPWKWGTRASSTEKRRDLTDGNLYTKEEFRAHYGGLSEWLATPKEDFHDSANLLPPGREDVSTSHGDTTPAVVEGKSKDVNAANVEETDKEVSLAVSRGPVRLVLVPWRPRSKKKLSSIPDLSSTTSKKIEEQIGPPRDAAERNIIADVEAETDRVSKAAARARKQISKDCDVAIEESIKREMFDVDAARRRARERVKSYRREQSEKAAQASKKKETDKKSKMPKKAKRSDKKENSPGSNAASIRSESEISDPTSPSAREAHALEHQSQAEARAQETRRRIAELRRRKAEADERMRRAMSRKRRAEERLMKGPEIRKSNTFAKVIDGGEKEKIAAKAALEQEREKHTEVHAKKLAKKKLIHLPGK